MTTFHEIAIKCPHCETLMRDYEMMSYTVHQSINYSDGFCDNGISKIKDIGICAQCNGVFWREDAKLSEELEMKVMDGLESALDMMDLPWKFDDDRQEKQILFYHELLKSEFADKDWKETYLRTRLWWSINDLIRNLSEWYEASNLKQFRAIRKHRRQNLHLFSKYKKLLEENLDGLIFLYIKGGDVDLLYLADMYREKEDFEKALEILQKIENKGSIYNQMKHKIRRKNSHVFQLNQ